MKEAELHDLSDDSDYTALQHQESTSSLTVNSGGMSDSSESEIVYSKENVAVHPSQYASERISGRLRIIKQGSSFFLTWIPYKATPNSANSVRRNLNSSVSDNDRNLYTIKPVPLSDIHSIRRHIPALGWQYIIIVLSSGLAFAPLYFYNGGVREFFAILKQHVFVVRSADDSNTFLLNDFQDPLQGSEAIVWLEVQLVKCLHIVGAAKKFSLALVSGICSAITRENNKEVSFHSGHQLSFGYYVQCSFVLIIVICMNIWCWKNSEFLPFHSNE